MPQQAGSFKLFSVGCRFRYGTNPQSFELDGTNSAQLTAQIFETLCSMKDVTYAGFPTYRVEVASVPPYMQRAETGQLEPHLTVESPMRAGQVIKFSARFGWANDYDYSMDEKGSRESLADRSATRPYRCMLVVPDQGTEGVLAVELSGRTHPTGVFTRLFLHRSRERAGTDWQNDDWYRLAVRPLSDEKRLEEAIASSSGAELRLQRRGINANGSPSKAEIILTDRLQSPRKMRQAVAAAKEWIDRLNGTEESDATDGSSVDTPSPLDVPDNPAHSAPSPVDVNDQVATSYQAQQVEALAQIVGDEFADIAFTDGSLQFNDGDGSTKVLTPTRADAIFTYPILTTDGLRADDQTFYTQVEARVRGIEDSLDASLTW